MKAKIWLVVMNDRVHPVGLTEERAKKFAREMVLSGDDAKAVGIEIDFNPFSCEVVSCGLQTSA